MPTHDSAVRIRSITVPILLVATVAMYFLPPAYFMVKSIAADTSVANLVWRLPRAYYAFWYPTAGFLSIAAVVVYRIETFHSRLIISLFIAGIWLLAIGNFGIYLQLMFPGWLTNTVIIIALAYPP